MPNSNGSGKKQLAQLREWNEVVLTCRDFGHAWQLGGWSHEDGVRVRDCTCLRCGTVRTEGIARRTGELKFRRYHDRPLGYLAAPGTGRIAVSRIRVEVLERAGE